MPISPPRGLIYDRNGVILADNQPFFEFEVIPENMDPDLPLPTALRELSGLLEFNFSDDDIEAIGERVKASKKFAPVTIASKLTEEQVATFAVNQYRFPGFSVSTKLKRFYPFGDVFTHAVGYVARINPSDQEQLKNLGKAANYAGTQDIGKLGIEKYYEDILHGKAGESKVEVDRKGRVVQTIELTPPVPGEDITVSLDSRLQLKARDILGDTKGAIIMMDPNTGEILVFYSNPSYDPNTFVRGITNKEYQALLNDPDRPLLNRVSQGVYGPASTVKPLMAIMGLNEGIISASTRFFGGPYYTLPGSTHKFRDWRRWGHGWMDLLRAIEISCDTFFYDLAFKAGIDNINKYMGMFGFGKHSGIDIYEESLANLPSKEWKKRVRKQVWVPGDTIPIGIGQGLWTTTPLQLSRAHSILISKGKNVIPHFAINYDDLAKPVFDANHPDEQFSPHPETAIRVNSQSFYDLAMKGMHMVINGPEGTARRAFAGTPYKAAGKSGTGQIVAIKQDGRYNAAALKKEHRDNALFVAFAPYDKPQAIVVVILENAGGGSSKAAPVARQMLDEYLLPNDKWKGEAAEPKPEDNQVSEEHP